MIAVLLVGCGADRGGRSSSTMPMPALLQAGAGAPSRTEPAEQLVITGALRMEVDQVVGLVPALRGHVEQLGGRVVGEEVVGADASWSAQLTLRVPPAQVEPLVSWLDERGDILEKKVSASDVSKQLFDQELALKNAQVTLDRLDGVLRQGGLSMQDVLAIEQELTRLRGQIETIKGEAQFLRDRVAQATLEVWITTKAQSAHLAEAKVYPGARISTLVLLDPGERSRTRMGAGMVMHTFFRDATLELELFRGDDAVADPASGDAKMGVVATFGGAFYSDFLGRGQRSFASPYLGFRAGYAYLDAHRFVTQAEAGLELFKSRRLMIDANARLTGLIGASSDAAVMLGASAVIAF